MLVAANEAFGFGLVSRYVSAGEVLDELFPPIGGQRRYCRHQLLGGGGFLELPSLP